MPSSCLRFGNKSDTAVSWIEIHELQLIWEDLLIVLLAKVKLIWCFIRIHLWYQDTQGMHNYNASENKMQNM